MSRLIISTRATPRRVHMSQDTYETHLQLVRSSPRTYGRRIPFSARRNKRNDVHFRGDGNLMKVTHPLIKSSRLHGEESCMLPSTKLQ